MKLPFDTNSFPDKKDVFVVGGSIRDLLCGRTPYDYDLVVKDNPDLFAKQLASETKGYVVEFGKPGQTILRVVTDDLFFDIMPVNGPTIEDDLRQRDFTINAMALELSTGALIDQLGGREDLAAKKIRMVSSDVFRNDPVRLIRAFRLAAEFDFIIEADTEATIRRDAYLIEKSAGERIRAEFVKILKQNNSYNILSRMAHSGLLFFVIPEASKIKSGRTAADASHEVIQRTIGSYYHLEDFLNTQVQFVPSISRQLLRNIDSHRAMLLKFAALLNAIGRPAVQKAPIERAIHCFSHGKKNAALARKISQRLKFSRKEADYIESIIRYHCRVYSLFNAQQKNAPLQKAIIRFFMKCGDITPDVLLLALAQLKGVTDPEAVIMRKFSYFVLKLLQKYYAVFRPATSLPPLLTGNDLIHEFGLSPSPLFRRILTRVKEERLLKMTLTREDAIKVVEKLLRQHCVL